MQRSHFRFAWLLAVLLLMAVGRVTAQHAADVETVNYQFYFGPNATIITGLVVRSGGTILVADNSNTNITRMAKQARFIKRMPIKSHLETSSTWLSTRRTICMW